MIARDYQRTVFLSVYLSTRFLKNCPQKKGLALPAPVADNETIVLTPEDAMEKQQMEVDLKVSESEANLGQC